MTTPATLPETARERASPGFGRIAFNPAILGGKPIIRGSRVSVEWVLEAIAAGGCVADIVRDHPHLTTEDVRQAILFAAANLNNDIFLSVELP